MSDHWRLAFRCAGLIILLAIPAGALLMYLYGGPSGGAFGYGVAVGLLSLLSTALTVTLLARRSMAGGMAVGAASFAGRCVFAAGALGAPAYLGLWPVLPMLGGFAGVYLAENVVLLPGALKISHKSIKREAERSARERVERRAEA
jgi:hypothetical protein